MSSIAQSYSSAALRSAPASRDGGLFQRLIEKLRFEIELRRSLREVESLNDSMLRDIGLQRGGLEYALRHGVSDVKRWLPR